MKHPDPHKPLTRKEWDALGTSMHGIEGLPVEAREAVKRLIGRPRLERPKKSITLRIDPDVVEAFKATGKGWQTRMTDVLRKASGVIS